MMKSNPKNHPISEWLEVDPSQKIERLRASDRLLTHISHRAMATDFVAILPTEDAKLIEIAIDALEELNQIEAALTVYQPESEISQINRLADKHAVKVSWSTFRLIQRALRWSDLTEGAFDITAGPLVEAWGFLKRQGRKPNRQEIEDAKNRVGFQNIELDDARQTIAFRRPNMAINLGAIGKGFALDRIAGRFREQGINHFLLHGGNSSVIAGGDQDPGSGEGWAVGIAHPTKPKRRLAGLWLRDEALGTSGSGKQFFHHRGQRYGHVIDPRSGYPSGDLQALTNISRSATDADACATGMFVAGSEKTQSWADLDWFSPTIMIRQGHRQDASEIRSVGVVHWVDPPTSK